MSIKSFRDLDVWKAAVDLATSTYRETCAFPSEERFGLTSQMRRSATSVAANIAEGHARNGTREFLHFVSIALGSLAELETETLKWCREMLAHSPLALRCLKAALNADCDGQMGLLDLAGNATLLYYMSEEGKEGKQAFVEKRPPDFSKFPRVP